MANTFLLVMTVVLAVSLTVLALSTYGLGKNFNNKGSIEYSSASAFTQISVTATIISIILLIIGAITVSGGSVNNFGGLGNSGNSYISSDFNPNFRR